jgi:hypothetical protein
MRGPRSSRFPAKPSRTATDTPFLFERHSSGPPSRAESITVQSGRLRASGPGSPRLRLAMTMGGEAGAHGQPNARYGNRPSSYRPQPARSLLPTAPERRLSPRPRSIVLAKPHCDPPLSTQITTAMQGRIRWRMSAAGSYS